MDLLNASRPLNPDETTTFILVVNVLVGVVSTLSLIGGILIPATWFVSVCSPQNSANPPPRSSPARVILCFLGIADALVALSHLSGVIVGYEKYSVNNVTGEISNSKIHAFCIIQGGLAVYSTVASFLWTIILSLFVSATMLLRRSKPFGGCCAIIIYCIVGWGIPAGVWAILLAMRDYGYERDVSLCESINGKRACKLLLLSFAHTFFFVLTAWCYSKSQGSPRAQRDIINLLSYDLWGAITLVILGTPCL